MRAWNSKGVLALCPFAKWGCITSARFIGMRSELKRYLLQQFLSLVKFYGGELPRGWLEAYRVKPFVTKNPEFIQRYMRLSVAGCFIFFQLLMNAKYCLFKLMVLRQWNYRKRPCISRTFFHKIEAINQGCGLSMDTSVFGVREYSQGKWPTVSLSLTTFSANLSTALSSSCSAWIFSPIAGTTL